MKRPSVDDLRSVATYDPLTGFLTWKIRPLDRFTSERQQKRWNTRHAGNPAFSCLHHKGYLHGPVLGSQMGAHVAAFAIFHGEYPEGVVDHINRDRTDNRITNLRDVSANENSRNRKPVSPERSGFTGTHFVPRLGKWVAVISDAGKQKHLGCFNAQIEAITARRSAEILLGYHPNHGRALPSDFNDQSEGRK